MEHFFLDYTDEELDGQVQRINKAKVLSYDWDKAARLSREIDWQIFPWLGFDHNRKSGQKSWVPFLDYPRSRGWDVDMLDSGDTRIKTASLTHLMPTWQSLVAQRTTLMKQDYALFDIPELGERVAYGTIAMMQSWLTLGLLEAVYKRPFDASFIQRSSAKGTLYIDTRCLAFLFTAVDRQTRESRSDRDSHKRLKSLRSLQDKVGKVINQLTKLNDSLHRSSKLSDPADLSNKIRDIVRVNALIWESTYCRDALARQTGQAGGCKFEGQPYYILRQSNMERLRSLGLCPSFVENLWPGLVTVHEWLCWWAKTFKFPREEDHRRCTPQDCALSRTPEALPQHKSWCDVSSCVKVVSNVQEVYSALESGGTPLVQLKGDLNGGGININVKACFDLTQTHYVAFSHVWRQDLGSTPEDGLEQCKLRDLVDVLNMADEYDISEDGVIQSSHFWIDAICVPKSKTHKIKAIASISDVMRNAKRTLVVDTALRKLKRSEHSRDSLAAAIGLSAWRTRLWTFLESNLAQQLDFILKDTTLTVRTSSKSPSNNSTYILDSDRTALTSIFGLFNATHIPLVDLTIPPLKHIESSSVRSISEILLFSIANKTFTAKEDEAIILGTLCNLEVERIALAESHEERMRAFYEQVYIIPVAWLFLRNPRSNAPGLGWAPESLLMSKTPTSYISSIHDVRDDRLKSRRCKMLPNGLHCTLPALVLDRPRDPPREDNTGEYAVQVQRKDNPKAGYEWINYVKHHRGRTWLPDEQYDILALNYKIKYKKTSEDYGLMLKAVGEKDYHKARRPRATDPDKSTRERSGSDASRDASDADAIQNSDEDGDEKSISTTDVNNITKSIADYTLQPQDSKSTNDTRDNVDPPKQLVCKVIGVVGTKHFPLKNRSDVTVREEGTARYEKYQRLRLI